VFVKGCAVEEEYLRLDCRIKRYNRMTPASFIIDAVREPAAAAVFDRRSHESLDHRKGQGPRPLKTHAYNFSYIEDDQGKALVGERASNRQEAEAFAETIMGAAKAIPREAYLEELDRIIWPLYVKDEPGMRGLQSRVMMLQDRMDEPPPNVRFKMNRDAGPSIPQSYGIPSQGDVDASEAPASERGDRKYLLKETLRLMERMDRDDLRSLYRYALMLLNE
jgi:hypothetical protein